MRALNTTKGFKQQSHASVALGCLSKAILLMVLYSGLQGFHSMLHQARHTFLHNKCTFQQLKTLKPRTLLIEVVDAVYSQREQGSWGLCNWGRAWMLRLARKHRELFPSQAAFLKTLQPTLNQRLWTPSFSPSVGPAFSIITMCESTDLHRSSTPFISRAAVGTSPRSSLEAQPHGQEHPCCWRETVAAWDSGYACSANEHHVSNTMIRWCRWNGYSGRSFGVALKELFTGALQELINVPSTVFSCSGPPLLASVTDLQAKLGICPHNSACICPESLPANMVPC